MRVLVDTNVFLDLLIEREGTEEAFLFFKNCIVHRNETLLTSISLRDIGYIAHKYFHDNKKARSLQAKAYQFCTKVISITNDDAIESIYSDISDYEDSLMVEAAKREMADLIVTNNIKDFKKARFPVWTPKEFNAAIEKIEQYGQNK